MRRTLGATVLAAAVAVAALVGPASVASAERRDDIVTIASEGGFTTLVAAVVHAELVEELSTNRSLTVFAPTDAAFAKLGLDAANISSLPKDAVADILLYHVTAGRKFSENVVAAPSQKMLNGDRAPRSELTADIVSPDVVAGNGVVHVIGTVLIPPAN
jgi:uncharacterized surface protein with fasciclin (FAS1) repeats